MISGWLAATSFKRFAGFLFSPAGKFLVVVLAFVLWTMYQRADATAACIERYETEELAEANRQAEIAQDIAAAARARADKTEGELTELGLAYEKLKTEIESGEAGSCPIPDDLRKRLLGIK